MPNKVFNDLTELAEGPAIADLFAISDISDNTDAPFGTSKKNRAQYALGSQVNAQTGTSYTYLTTDFRKLVTHSNGSAIAGTLPQAGASFPAGWFMFVQNRGAGVLTITPTTSTIDGAATLVLSQNEGAIVISDGTNYFTLRGKATGAAGVGDVVGPASATDEAIARFDTTTGKLLQDSPVTVNNDGAITIPEIASPSTPAAGKIVLYGKADNKIYIKDEAGLETDLTGGGGTPGGSDKYVQYNDGGAFGGVSDFTFDETTRIVQLSQSNNGRIGFSNTAGTISHGCLAAGAVGTMKILADGSAAGSIYSPETTMTTVGSDPRPFLGLAGQVQTHTLTGNRTLGFVGTDGGAVAKDGTIFTLIFIQDATGSRTLAWNSGYKFAGGTTPTLTTAAGSVDIFVFVVSATGTKAYCIGQFLDVK